MPSETTVSSSIRVVETPDQPGAGGAEIIARVEDMHQEQLALCRTLEDIADSLPTSIDPQRCMLAAKALGPVISGMHHYEEQHFFPWIRTQLTGDLTRTLDRLRFEHLEDACFAEELTDALLKLGAGTSTNMDALGYMLRGFFEGLRRHIAFEQELLRQRLPPT